MDVRDFRDSSYRENRESRYEDNGTTVFQTESLAYEESTGQDGSRKLIVTAHLRIRLIDLEDGENNLREIIAQYSAYTAFASIYENRQNYTIRVSSGEYQSCLADLKNMGKALFYSEKTEDITVSYYDLENRLDTQRKLLSTFQAYLGKAASIDEIMTVERRIAELQNEIDHTGSQFKSLSHQVDYATIELELLSSEFAQNSDRQTIGEKIANLFHSFGDYVSVVLLIMLGLVIYGIPSILILFLLYWLLLGKIGLLKKLWKVVGPVKNAKNEKKN